MANTHSRTIARARALHSTRATAHSRGRRFNDGTSSRATSGSHTQCTSVPPGAHLHMMCQRLASPHVRGTEARWPNRRVPAGPSMPRLRAAAAAAKPTHNDSIFRGSRRLARGVAANRRTAGCVSQRPLRRRGRTLSTPPECSAPLEHAVASSRARAGISDPLLQMPVAFGARCVMNVAAPGDGITTGHHTFSRARALTRAPHPARDIAHS